MIGATTMPPIAPIIAAMAKLNSVMRGTSMPISRAASGFSAQARKLFAEHGARQQVPQRQDHASVAVPAIQKPCVEQPQTDDVDRRFAGKGRQIVRARCPRPPASRPRSASASRRSASACCCWAAAPAPARMSPRRAPRRKPSLPTTAPRAASGAGQFSVTFERVHRQRADDAERALRQIDDAGDAKDQREAERDDGKHAALKQPADDDRGHLT